MQCICSVLQCAVEYCSTLQCLTAFCRVLKCVASSVKYFSLTHTHAPLCNTLSKTPHTHHTLTSGRCEPSNTYAPHTHTYNTHTHVLPVDNSHANTHSHVLTRTLGPNVDMVHEARNTSTMTYTHKQTDHTLPHTPRTHLSAVFPIRL